MFTGIITHIGTVSSKTKTGFVVKTAPDFLRKIENGTSVAVDGICLTVTNYRKNSFDVDVMPETVQRTNVQYLHSGNLVNLELPMTAQTFLSGHIVQGHIDGVAILKEIVEQGNSRLLKFWISPALAKYIVEKGSITVNGISLTVIKAEKNYFTVGIIPHTWNKTMLYTIKVGATVNIELDILAKYIKKLIKKE